MTTEADILDAIREALKPSEVNTEGAWTYEQLADLTNLPEKRIRKALQELTAQGRLQVVRVPFIRVDGMRYTKPGYRLV